MIHLDSYHRHRANKSFSCTTVPLSLPLFFLFLRHGVPGHEGLQSLLFYCIAVFERVSPWRHLYLLKMLFFEQRPHGGEWEEEKFPGNKPIIQIRNMTMSRTDVANLRRHKYYIRCSLKNTSNQRSQFNGIRTLNCWNQLPEHVFPVKISSRCFKSNISKLDLSKYPQLT